MSSIRKIMPEQNSWSLFFRDVNLEIEFRASYNRSVRMPLRYGMIISILSWYAAIPLVFFLIRDQFNWLAPLTLVFIGSFFGFILFTTFNQKFLKAYHFIGACSNAWAGLYAIYFCGRFPGGDHLILPVLIFILFFGWYLVRLRWMAGFLAALTYIIGYNVYIIEYSELSLAQIVLYSFVAWITLIFAVLAGRIAEQKNRLTWIQSKTIREQNEIIQQEKEASEVLLRNMLPNFIAERLKENPEVIADSHHEVSVLFADLVGFTSLASNRKAREVVVILNRIFSKFDELSDQLHLEKIKTIGDGYMVSGGLYKKEDHLERIASLALDIIDYFQRDEEIQKLKLQIRIGIHVGPVIAGVIGTSRYTYDLWGDTVNIASRLESQGEPNKVVVSEAVHQKLDGKFSFIKRERIHLRGKGEAQTYFLVSE